MAAAPLAAAHRRAWKMESSCPGFCRRRGSSASLRSRARSARRPGNCAPCWHDPRWGLLVLVGAKRRRVHDVLTALSQGVGARPAALEEAPDVIRDDFAVVLEASRGRRWIHLQLCSSLALTGRLPPRGGFAVRFGAAPEGPDLGAGRRPPIWCGREAAKDVRSSESPSFPSFSSRQLFCCASAEALFYASEELRRDGAWVLELGRHSPGALVAALEAQSLRTLTLCSAMLCILCSLFLASSLPLPQGPLATDRAFLVGAVALHPVMLSRVGEEIRSDRDFLLEAWSFWEVRKLKGGFVLHGGPEPTR